MSEPFQFQIGQRVAKVGGDYAFAGRVVAAFAKRSGVARYVVEDDRGILMIYSAKNLRAAIDDAGAAGEGRDSAPPAC